MCGPRGGTGVRPPPPPLENHKAIVLVRIPWNIPAFKWRFADGPMMSRFKCYLDPLSSPHQLKTVSRVGPADKAFWIRAWVNKIVADPVDMFIGFRSVVVITLALHARGPGFEPQRNQLLQFCFNDIFEWSIPSKSENTTLQIINFCDKVLAKKYQFKHDVVFQNIQQKIRRNSIKSLLMSE